MGKEYAGSRRQGRAESESQVNKWKAILNFRDRMPFGGMPDEDVLTVLPIAIGQSVEITYGDLRKLLKMPGLLRRATEYFDHKDPAHDCAPMYGCFCGMVDLLNEIDEVTR